MQVETITYSRTVNLGDYQSEKLEMTASLESYDDPNEAAHNLKHLVHWNLGLTKTKPKYVKQADIAEVVEGGDIKTTKGETIAVDETLDVLPEAPKKKTKKKVTKKKVVKEEKVELPPVIIELSDVKEAFKNLAKTRGLPIAREVLKDFGAVKTDDLKSEQYAEAMAKVVKCLK